MCYFKTLLGCCLFLLVASLPAFAVVDTQAIKVRNPSGSGVLNIHANRAIDLRMGGNDNNSKFRVNSKVHISSFQLLGGLLLKQQIPLSLAMIQTALSKKEPLILKLGSFCSLTNDYENRLFIRADNNLGDFHLLNVKKNTSLPYGLYINDSKVKYGVVNQITANGGKAYEKCEGTELEQVSLHIPYQHLRIEDAGTYRTSFQLSSGGE
ncbi:hypothetical protein N8865_00735 [Francisellaceae bacterium]|nr:hypothetical protein [Francisellaceae bacterium]